MPSNLKDEQIDTWRLLQLNDRKSQRRRIKKQRKDAWPPQASFPCGNFSDTSCYNLSKVN